MKISEQLYTDLTNIVLPKIQDWLIVAKDYWMDLWEGYTTYMTMTDWLMFWLSILWVTLLPYIMYKIIKSATDDKKKIGHYSGDMELTELNIIIVFTAVIWWFVVWVSIFWIFTNWANTIKDLTIPEIRIYEEIKAKWLLK